MHLLSGPSDDSIIRQVLSGRRQQFGMLVQRHLPSVYAVAYAQTHNHADAEDVSQETFLKAFITLDSLRDRRRFEGWVVTIARNLAHALWQDRKREAAVAEALPKAAGSLPDEVARREMQALLRQRIEGLDPMQREILLLHYFAGKSTHEIAAMLEISRAAAKKRLQRAREALSQDLLATLEDAFEPPRSLTDQSKVIIAAVSAAGLASWEAAGSAALAPAGLLAKLAGVAMSPGALALAAGGAIAIGVAVWNAGENLEATELPESTRREIASLPQAPPSPPAVRQSAASPSQTVVDRDIVVQEETAVLADAEDVLPPPVREPAAIRADVEEALDKPTNMEFENIHIGEICEFVSMSYDINLVVDQRAVAPPVRHAAGRSSSLYPFPSPHLYMTDGMVGELRVSEKPLREALTALCEPLGLTYVVAPGFVWISTPEMIAADTSWRVSKSARNYDTEALLDTTVRLEFSGVHINDILMFIANAWDINLVLDTRVVQPAAQGGEEVVEAPARATFSDVHIKGPIRVSQIPKSSSFSEGPAIQPPSPRGEGVVQPSSGRYPDTVVTNGIVSYVNLKEIALRDALEAVLRPLDLTYSIEEGFVWITSADLLPRERFAPLNRTGISPKVSEALQGTPEISVAKLHLAKALAYLESESGLPVYVDTRVMTPDSPQLYQLKCQRLPVYLLLSIATRECGMGYVAEGDRVMVSTPDRLLTREFPEPYYVRAQEFPVAAPENAPASETASFADRQPDSTPPVPGELTFYSIQAAHGSYRVQLQTPSGVKRWYSVGEQFEQYQLLDVDADQRTCTLHDERLNRDVTLRLGSAADGVLDSQEGERPAHW